MAIQDVIMIWKIVIGILFWTIEKKAMRDVSSFCARADLRRLVSGRDMCLAQVKLWKQSLKDQTRVFKVVLGLRWVPSLAIKRKGR